MNRTRLAMDNCCTNPKQMRIKEAHTHTHRRRTRKNKIYFYVRATLLGKAHFGVHSSDNKRSDLDLLDFYCGCHRF